MAELRKKISQFVPVIVTADTEGFSESETKVLDLLIAASQYLNPIFNRQSFELYKETRERLVKERFVKWNFILTTFNALIPSSARGPSWNILM